MDTELLRHLRDPESGENLVSVGNTLRSEKSGRVYPVLRGIPRFVSDESYAANFGEQWNHYRRTQLDSFNGTTISRDRFTGGTGWNLSELRGQRILEAGCGAGRFTEIMLNAGAEVFAFDYSSAVDACAENFAGNPHLHIVQADIYRIPFPKNFFDKIFCFGVLQHTPDPKRAFLSLLPHLRTGGKIAVDSYRKRFRISRTYRPSRFDAKYLYRHVTKRMPVKTLRKFVEWYVPKWLPVDNYLQRIPVLGSIVPVLVPCWNYTGILPLKKQQIVEWAILDTFDALAPRYDFPQRGQDIEQWFREGGLADIDVHYGGNGIIGNAVKPAEPV